MGRTKGAEMEQAETWTPEQKAVAKPMGRYLQERIGMGLPTYEGPLYVPLSDEETQMLKEYGRMAPGVAGAYEAALGGAPTPGYSPSQVESLVAARKATAARAFEEETLPGIREEYRGPGTYWGGARAMAVSEARERFGEEQTEREEALRWEAEGRRVELAEAAKGRQLAAAPGAAAAYGEAAERGIRGEEAIRIAQLQEIQVDFQEWLRTRPELSPIISQAIQFLGVPAVATVYQPPYLDFWQQIALAQVAGAAEIGAAVAGAQAGGA